MTFRNWLRQVLFLLSCVILAVAIAVIIATIAWGGGRSVNVELAFILAISSGLTMLIGAPMLWLIASPLGLSLRARLVLSLTAGVVSALLNVVVTAWLMFISPHDLALLSLLLVFSFITSLSVSVALAQAITDRLKLVTMAARRLAHGDLTVRVPAVGHGDLAEVAEDFNRMAARLEDSFKQLQAVDGSRRALLANVSHDLRSPLSSIRVAVEAVHDGLVASPEESKRYLNAALKEVSNLSRLIDDLFELAQVDSGFLELHLERIALGDLVSDAIESMRPRAEQHGIALGGAVSGDTVAVIDAVRIERVIANLLDNAISHGKPGGNIKVEACEVDGTVRLDVQDDGEGIPAEVLPYVFDRFYRADPSRNRGTGGAGLGLAISRAFVQAHDGAINISSTVGTGTTVQVQLPKNGPHATANLAMGSVANGVS